MNVEIEKIKKMNFFFINVFFLASNYIYIYEFELIWCGKPKIKLKNWKSLSHYYLNMIYAATKSLRNKGQDIKIVPGTMRDKE